KNKDSWTWTKNTKTMEKNIWHVGENNENLQNYVFKHWTTSAKTDWQCDSHHGTWQQMPCHLDEDTDVFVLALSFCSHINANLYFHTAKGRESQITDLSKLHSHLGQEKCDALVGLHPFSGCDTVSALYGLGKIKAYKKLNSKKEYIDLFRQLGDRKSV